jgi:RNA polymerase sigma-70 factor (ECF subfamily)
VRVELCREAMRLCSLLLEHAPASKPATHALLALMCLHAARLPARVDAGGEFHSFFEQDRARWDRELIEQGRHLLALSAKGDELSEYHVEAAIAAVHANARTAEETSWEQIVTLYDALLRIRPSPVIALNRAIALAQHAGPERGLEALHAIADRGRLAGYPFYFAALGELEFRCGRPGLAGAHFRAALALARNATERGFLEQRVAACEVSAP